jgi:hypothetical protein
LELINRGHEHPNVLIGYALPGGRGRQELIDVDLATFQGFALSGELGRICTISAFHDGEEESHVAGHFQWDLDQTNYETKVHGYAHVRAIKAYFHVSLILSFPPGPLVD